MTHLISSLRHSGPMRSVLISFTVGLLARARRVTCSWLLSSTSTILTTGP